MFLQLLSVQLLLNSLVHSKTTEATNLVTEEPPYLGSKKGSKLIYPPKLQQLFSQSGLAGCKNAACLDLEGTPLSAWRDCCALGLIPATFSTVKEIQCLSNAFGVIKRSGKYDAIFNRFEVKDSTYITSHIDAYLNHRFFSCYTGDFLSRKVWSGGEPDNGLYTEACISVNLAKGGGFNDVPCDVFVRPYLCESVPASVKSVNARGDVVTSKFYKPEVVSELIKLKVPNCMGAGCESPVNFEDAIKTNKVLPYGSIKITDCNKIGWSYIALQKLVSYPEVWGECCALGGVPVSVDTTEELKCLMDNLDPGINATSDISYWTSAVDWRLEGKLRSCVSMKDVAENLTWPAFFNKNEACSMLVFNPRQLGLVNTNCDVKANVLCQFAKKVEENKASYYSEKAIVKLEKSKIPGCKAMCEPAIGTARLPLPSIAVKSVNCTKQFYGLVNMVPMTQAWSWCCKYGLVPGTIDNATDIACLKKFRTFPNSQLFTASVDINLDNNFTSCVTGTKVSGEDLWLNKQPHTTMNKEIPQACITLTYNENQGGLHANNCEDSHIPLCEVPPVVNPGWKAKLASMAATRTTNKNNNNADKEEVDITYQNFVMNYHVAARFYQCQLATCQNTQVNAVMKLKAEKSIVKCGGKSFYFSAREVDATNSWSECCALGMVPATITYLDMITCLAKAAQGLNLTGSIFHTAAIDANLDRGFISCSSGDPVANVWFMFGEPDNKKARESCVALNLGKPMNGLLDIACITQAPVICEVPENIKKFSSPWMYNSLKSPSSTTTKKPALVVGKQSFSASKNNSTSKDGEEEGPSLTYIRLRMDYTLQLHHVFSRDGLATCRGFTCTNIEVPARDAVKECCDLGMVPVTFTNFEELKCLKEAYGKISPASKNLLAANKDSIFWTSYVDAWLDHRYISCYNGKVAGKSLWVSTDPNNLNSAEACVGVNLGAGCGLADTSCLPDALRPVVCENVPDSVKSVTPWREKVTSKFYKPETTIQLMKLNVPNCIKGFCDTNNTAATPPKTATEISSCDTKNYYRLPEKLVSFSEVWGECCAMGALPVSVDTGKELECLIANLNNSKGEVRYWTSQVDWRLEGKIRSCVNMEEVNDDVMWTTFVNRTEACAVLAISAQSSSVLNVNCDTKAAVLCQIPKVERYLPDFKLKMELQNFTGCRSSMCDAYTFKNPMPILNTALKTSNCTKQYYLPNGAIPGTFSETWTTCCRYGLVPATVPNRTDFNCIKNTMFPKAPVYNSYVFVASIDSQLDGHWSSCTTGLKVTPDLLSEDGTQPRISAKMYEACMMITYENKVGLVNVDCNSKNLMLCEAEPVNNPFWKARLQPSTTTPAPNVVSVTYAPIAVNQFKTSGLLNCQHAWCPYPSKDPSFKLKAEREMIRCGVNKMMYFHKTEVTAVNIWSECCALGLIPATVTSLETVNYLVKGVAGLNWTMTTYHTSGVDVNLTRGFMSCSSREQVLSEGFLAREPDNKQGREACVALNISSVAGGLLDVPCNLRAPVLCEVPTNASLYNSPWIYEALTGFTVSKPPTTTETISTTIKSKAQNAVINSKSAVTKPGATQKNIPNKKPGKS